ncbi:glycosyltransferase [Rhodococcus sp. NCIMB 12038]|uniref:glycosyltransferase n=1 Tax=Rhodococcus sp. NCIMB 12038 TaxID=933800 RepID=UPI0015C62ECD|nr:glycosyltransferase [Rhodococcus sp. NCIMB 12038]
MPRSKTVQVHRMDVAVAIKFILRPKLLAYFVHTQQKGLTGSNSDSLWRYGQRLHSALESYLIKTSSDVIVFNPEHADHANKLNPQAKFSPTWFDPDLLLSGEHQRIDHSIIWVGRMEVPKDPRLALNAFARLIEMDPGRGWTLRMIGGGSLENELKSDVAKLPETVSERVEIVGRMEPRDLSAAMASSHVFLMTSHAGYEGFPRVLVEAMAAGLPAVVTQGSDTGGLVKPGVTGFTTSRDPEEISRRIIDATRIDPRHPRSEVSRFSAPQVVGQIVRTADRDLVASRVSDTEK